MNKENEKIGKQVTPQIEATISAVAAAYPKKIVTSEELSRSWGLEPNWVFDKTGIKERRKLAPGEQNSDISAQACRSAVEKAGWKMEEVELVIACTTSPDRWSPGLASAVQKNLGIMEIPSIDLVGACSGWLAGVQFSKALIQNGTYRRILLIGSDVMSRFVNPDDKATASVFGDGAAAAVISAMGNDGYGHIIDVIFKTNPTHFETLKIDGSGSMWPASKELIESGKQFISMNGEKVFLQAVRGMTEIASELLKKHGLSLNEIDWLVPHQANKEIIDNVGIDLNFDPKKIATNIELYGNTTAATIPSCLSQYVEAGKIRRGQLILLVAFGAGMSRAAALIKW